MIKCLKCGQTLIGFSLHVYVDDDVMYCEYCKQGHRLVKIEEEEKQK